MPGAANQAHTLVAPAVALERLGHVVLGGVVIERHAVTLGDLANGYPPPVPDDGRALAGMIQIPPEVAPHEVDLIAGAVLVEVERGPHLHRIPRGCRYLAAFDREEVRAQGDRADGDQVAAIARDQHPHELGVAREKSARGVRREWQRIGGGRTISQGACLPACSQRCPASSGALAETSGCSLPMRAAPSAPRPTALSASGPRAE